MSIDPQQKNKDHFDQKSPLVSIIIPLYNHEKYIQETIESIVLQTYQNIEIILVDDASTDNGLNYAKAKLRNSGVLFKIIENSSNLGVCATVNRGISAAGGKYSCLIASDDMLIQGRIKRHVEILQHSQDLNVIACYGPLKVISEDGSFVGLKGELLNKKNYDLASVVTKKANPCLQGCTFITKKLKIFPFDENLFFEDWDFFIRLFLNGYSIIYDDNVSAIYRISPGGVSKQIDQMISARQDIQTKHFSEISKKNKILAQEFLFTIAFSNLMSISYSGKISSWIKYFSHLFLLSPKTVLNRSRDILWSIKNLIILKSRKLLGKA
jgi:alpha-1,3-rhamnosyltransferase